MFTVEGGAYSPATGRLIWTERSRTSSLVSECTGKVNFETKKFTVSGEYLANTGRRGKLFLYADVIR